MKTLYHFLSIKLNWLALAIVGAFFLIAFAAPVISPPADPERPSDFKVHEGWFETVPLPPRQQAPLGTLVYNSLGADGAYVLHFDIFHSLVWGTRSVLRFGLVTALTVALVGTLIGAISGYVGGSLNRVMMRLTDAFLAFPVIAGVYLFRTIMEMADVMLFDSSPLGVGTLPQTLLQRLIFALGIDPVMLALIMTSWVVYARITSVGIARLKQQEFAEAARSLGMRDVRVLFRHLIPNAVGPVIVLLARDVGSMVILQAAFAFIGVSGTVTGGSIPEWSRMLMLGRDWVIGPGGDPLAYWWTYLPVTLAFVLFGMGWNLLGDGLNSTLNPREVTGR